MSLWSEYAEELPAGRWNDQRLRVQGWCTLDSEPRNNNSFESIQDVIDSKYLNRKFVRTYSYPQNWWLNSSRKLEKSGSWTDVTSFLDGFNKQVVGVDFDVSNEFKRLKTYFNCFDASNRMQVRASPSGRGLHIRLEHESTLSREARYEARMALGDCKGRLVCSASKGLDDVLFDMKRIKRRGYWASWSYEEPLDSSNMLALPAFSKVPREVYRR